MRVPDSQLYTLALRAAIVIAAIDDPPALLRINDLLYPIVEVLYPACHPAASSGHIIATIPYASACLRCSLDIASPSSLTTLHGEPGLGLDFRSIANQTSILALEIMHAKATGQPIKRWDISKNIFYFANRQDPQLSRDGPAVHLQRAEKSPGCHVCSAGP